MTFWVAGAVVASSLIGSDAAGNAAGEQSAATSQAAGLQRETAKEQLALQQRMYEENAARQQPWLQAGGRALTKLEGATDYTPFGMNQFNADPGYAFRLSEGQKAMERSAAARGGLMSGGALKAATRFGQDMGSQEYMNAFNRYQTERAAKLQPLQSLAGVGQTTANTLGAAGQQYATSAGNIAGQSAANIGDLMTSGAAARASGYVGGANALTSGLGTYLNYSQGQSYLNALRPQVPAQSYPSMPAGPYQG
jgi:hypothetical protein